jgi:hypothetical protein
MDQNMTPSGAIELVEKIISVTPGEHQGEGP